LLGGLVYWVDCREAMALSDSRPVSPGAQTLSRLVGAAAWLTRLGWVTSNAARESGPVERL